MLGEGHDSGVMLKILLFFSFSFVQLKTPWMIAIAEDTDLGNTAVVLGGMHVESGTADRSQAPKSNNGSGIECIRRDMDSR